MVLVRGICMCMTSVSRSFVAPFVSCSCTVHVLLRLLPECLFSICSRFISGCLWKSLKFDEKNKIDVEK